MIRLDALSVDFDERFQLHDIEWTLRPGEHWLITGVNGSGLWIFLRSPARDDKTINMVRGLAAAQGFDLSVLKNVTHDGCTYAA